MLRVFWDGFGPPDILYLHSIQYLPEQGYLVRGKYERQELRPILLLIYGTFHSIIISTSEAVYCYTVMYKLRRITITIDPIPSDKVYCYVDVYRLRRITIYWYQLPTHSTIPHYSCVLWHTTALPIYSLVRLRTARRSMMPSEEKAGGDARSV